MSVKALRHRVESGRWRRIWPGVLLAQSGPALPRQRMWCAVLALGADRHPDGVCLGGLTALRAWGLTCIEARQIDVVVGRGHRVRKLPGVVGHHTTAAPDLTAGRHLSPPASSPARSVLDAAAWATSDQQARLVIAASFQQGLVRLPELLRELDEHPNRLRRALVLRTATDCAGGSHSTAELELLAICRRAGLPEPSRQTPRRDRAGRLRFIDATFDSWKVAVEVDGAHHLNVAVAWDDASRANALELDGYVVLRYPSFVLREHPDRVAADVREALLRAGWTPEAASGMGPRGGSNMR